MNKRKLFLRNWLIAALILVAFPYLCFAHNCPDLEIFIKETAPELKTWKDIYKLFKSYPGCDDGAYAESYSEFVVHTLARYWDRFGELIELTTTDSNFHDFILNHIDATADIDDINTVIKNTLKRCPSGSEKFCKEIEKAALSTIEEFKKQGE